MLLVDGAIAAGLIGSACIECASAVMLIIFFSLAWLIDLFIWLADNFRLKLINNNLYNHFFDNQLPSLELVQSVELSSVLSNCYDAQLLLVNRFLLQG